jgi:hypothetical protein
LRDEDLAKFEKKLKRKQDFNVFPDGIPHAQSLCVAHASCEGGSQLIFYR